MVGERTLLLDSGNTKIKYLMNHSFGRLNSIDDLESLIRSTKVSQIVLSSVSTMSKSIEDLANSLDLPLHKPAVQKTFGGITVGYDDVTQLGVDRWLAMLAAHAKYSQTYLWVIDAGTALTMDCLSHDGEHHGGVIAPGLSLSSQSLHSKTARLPLSDLNFNGKLGLDTLSCINIGVVFGAVSLIEGVVQKYSEPDPLVLLTGGDAELMAGYLSLKCQIESTLVLDGLKVYWDIVSPSEGIGVK